MTMTPAELKLLHHYIDQSSHYLEFGSGQSTRYAADISTIQTIDSVESSEDYIQAELMPHVEIQAALKMQKLRFHLVDIGETGEWGEPINSEKKHLWPNYALSIFARPSQHDTVLIDGRFRVACAMSCLLNTPANTKLLIHDFWNRPEYHILLRVLTPIARADTLGVFAKKTSLDVNKIQTLMMIYQYHPNDRPNIKIKPAVPKA